MIIIDVLTLALITVTSLYLKQRDLIYEYFGNYNFSIDEDESKNNTNITTNR